VRGGGGGNPEVVLVLGGTRSGKSDWARRYCEEQYGTWLYLATAEPGDREMAERIDRHRRERGPAWGLVEEPRDICAAIRAASGNDQPIGVVLVDCLTVWLTNVLLTEGEGAVEGRVTELLGLLRDSPCALVLVANEVGMGIVPESALGRLFRDLAGMLNQRVAAAADRVVFVAAGLPLGLK